MTRRHYVLLICFDAHRADGYVWSVRWHGQWYSARVIVSAGVRLQSVYKGPTARQPRAYFTGVGWLRDGHRYKQQTLTIYPSKP